MMKDGFKETLRVLLTFLKIGAFTFGGGYAMISLIAEECTQKNNWITDEELQDMVAIAESTPGPVAVNCATYVGYKVGGIVGGILATLGVVLPAFLIIFLISVFFDDILSIELIAKAFKGIQIGVCVIIASVGIRMLLKMKKNAVNILFFSVSFAILFCVNFFNIGFSSLYIIVAAAVMGIIVYGISGRRADK